MMLHTVDARVPVRFGPPLADDALLIEGDSFAPAGKAAVRVTLAEDQVSAGRFRLVEG